MNKKLSLKVKKSLVRDAAFATISAAELGPVVGGNGGEELALGGEELALGGTKCSRRDSGCPSSLA